MSKNMELAGETIDGDEVVALAAELQPDAILMDLRMPGPGGIEATRKILSTAPTRASSSSRWSRRTTRCSPPCAGARGYLLEGADRDEMLLEIRAVARGGAVFGPGIAQRLIQSFSSPTPASSLTPHSIFPELTDRER